jgi:RNA polymerase sigma-70 factor, ECF subfamily
MTAPPPECEYAERLTRVFSEYAPQVYAYGLRRLKSPEDAEDLVAEVFLAAWRKVEQLPKEPAPWLLGIAYRRVVDAWRLARRHQRLLLALHTEAAAIVPKYSNPEDTSKSPVLAALAGLTESYQEVLTLFYWERLSVKEAAQVLGLRASTYLVRLHRARRHLLREIGLQVPQARLHMHSFSAVEGPPN